MPDSLIIQGDARHIPLADESVQCVVTSPPYWRQRDYGTAGQIGLETTPEEYVGHLLEIFREVRRVLRSDGVLWLNIGDKWASGGHGGGGSSGYKDKDLVGIPWMTAFALRADGWFLRQCNIWAKPNGMPESVRDRSTISHEYVFQLSKRNDYFYNSEAARTPMQPTSETRLAQETESQHGSDRANGGARTNRPMRAVRRSEKQRGQSSRHAGFNDRWDEMERNEQMQNGANLRSVWWIAPAQYREAHFAVMPEGLATICVLASSRDGDMICDPFAGSGTVGVVCARLNRRFVGIELSEEYCRMAVKRIAPYAAQAPLPLGG